MADRVIGLDVGTNAVRVAEVALGRNPRLLRFGQVGLPAGAVREGEVVDPDAVAAAIRRLWKGVGLRQRSVRVGIASARVILRTVDVPALSDADTRSALALQLEDYVPLAAESTVFGFQAIGSERAPRRTISWGRSQTQHAEPEPEPEPSVEADPTADPGTGTALERVSGPAEGQRRLLLAAAHIDAVRPLLEATSRAGLRVKAVDVIPAALARSLAPADEHDRPQVQAIASLGAGTTVVAVARAGMPLFARTVTNVSGIQVTDRIGTQLSLSAEQAEQVKRGIDIGLPSEVVDSVEVVTRRAVGEIVDEVADSLGYYASQPGLPPVERVVLTGGGAQVHGVAALLTDRIGLPVSVAELPPTVPGVPAGFADIDVPFLAPYLATAVGVALGGAGGAATIHLAPANAKGAGARRRPIIYAAAATTVALALGGTYVYRSKAIDHEQTALDTARRALDARQAASGANGTNASVQPSAGLVRLARTEDVDWPALSGQLRALSVPLGVEVATLQGSVQSVFSAQPGSTSSARSGTAGSAGSPAVTTTTRPTVAAGGGGTTGGKPAEKIGKLTIEGYAPNLQAVASWIDAVDANPRFADAWVSAVTDRGNGVAGLHFSASIDLTSINFVSRPTLDAAAK